MEKCCRYGVTSGVLSCPSRGAAVQHQGRPQKDRQTVQSLPVYPVAAVVLLETAQPAISLS